MPFRQVQRRTEMAVSGVDAAKPASKPSHFCPEMRKCARPDLARMIGTKGPSIASIRLRCIHPDAPEGDPAGGGKAHQPGRRIGRRRDEPIKLRLFYRLRTLNIWYSVSLCKDARPSAPSMSCGSRANQAKPEARSSCSEQRFKTASFADYREVSVRTRDFHRGGTGSCEFARPGAEAPRAGVSIWPWKTNSKTTFRI
jgi:hypothetical protein